MKKLIKPFSTILLVGLAVLISWGAFTRGWFGYNVPKPDAALEQVIEEQQQTITEKIQQIGVLETLRAMEAEQISQVEGERDALQTSVNEINSAISAALDDVYSALAEFYVTNGEAGTLEEGLTLAIATYGEPSLDALNPIVTSLITVIESSDGSGEDTSHLLEQISSLQQQVSTLQSQLQTANNTITSLNGQISTLNSSIQEKNAEISRLNQGIIEFLNQTFLFQNAATLYLLGVFEDINDAFSYLWEKYPSLTLDTSGDMALGVLEFAIEKMNKLVDQSFRFCAAILYDYFSEDFDFEDVDAALEFLREEFIPENADMPTFTHIFAMFDFVFTEFEYNLWEGFFPAS